MRALHRWPGLLAFILLAALGVSGAALSVFPAAERIAATQAEAALSVAELASRIQQAYPGVEQIRRSPSGVSSQITSSTPSVAATLSLTAWWRPGSNPPRSR